jgi:hypothetical protein
LAWDPKDVEPAKAVEKYNQHKPPARMFNPILMKFNDPQIEQLKSSQVRRCAVAVGLSSPRAPQEATTNLHRLNAAKDKQLIFEQKFNIVNHRSHVKVVAAARRGTAAAVKEKRCRRARSSLATSCALHRSTQTLALTTIF